MEKQQVSYWELEGTYQEIGKQMAKQPGEESYIYSGSGEVRRKRNGGSLPII